MNAMGIFSYKIALNAEYVWFIRMLFIFLLKTLSMYNVYVAEESDFAFFIKF